MKQINDGDPFVLYGQWNALGAIGPDKRVIDHIRAHDGDFFPESPLDYVEAMRASILTGTPPAPVRVDIDVTQVCNSACTFCFSRVYQTREYRRHYVPMDILNNTLERSREFGTKTIRYCGGGDPLMHPYADDIIKMPHMHGMNLCVISNFDFLDDRRASVILENVDHVRWSVNAASDDTRRLIHRPSKNANPLSKTMAHVRGMLRERGRGRPECRRPMIWATYLIVPENVHEVLTAYLSLADVGVDSVSFRPVYHGLHSEWTREKVTEVWNVMDKLKNISGDSGPLVFTPSRGVSSNNILDPNAYFGYCLSRDFRTVLEASVGGLMLQSCGSYRGSGTTPKGLVNQGQDFATVWAHRSAFPSPARAPADCSSCIDISMNKTLEFIRRNLERDPSVDFVRLFSDI